MNAGQKTVLIHEKYLRYVNKKSTEEGNVQAKKVEEPQVGKQTDSKRDRSFGPPGFPARLEKKPEKSDRKHSVLNKKWITL